MSRVIGYDTVLGGASVRPPQTIEYAEAPERPETDLDRAWAWLQGAVVAQGARARARRGHRPRRGPPGPIVAPGSRWS